MYHDFHVCIAMKRKKHLEEHDMLELPVKDLTLEQLQHLKVWCIVGVKCRVIYKYRIEVCWDMMLSHWVRGDWSFKHTMFIQDVREVVTK